MDDCGTRAAGAVSLTLVPHGRSVGEARRFLVSHLSERGLDHLADDAVLGLSELVTNAVLHARTTIRVVVDVDDTRLRVEVADDNDTLPVLRDYGPQATTGRGLGLVSTLASEMGVVTTGTGKAVWFCLRLTPVEPRPTPEPAVPDPSEEVARALLKEAGLTVAVLQGLPVDLWLAARQHHEAALRELALYQGRRLPGTVDAWEWFGAATSAHHELDACVEHALSVARRSSADLDPRRSASSTPAAVDVTVLAGDDLPGRLVHLLDALDLAELLAVRDELLLRPAPPPIVALRDWCCEQVIAQVEGRPVTAWHADDGDPHPGGSRGAHGELESSPDLVLLADEHGRVLAVSDGLVDRLGWHRDQLLGRRAVTLMPQEQRERSLTEIRRRGDLRGGEAPDLAGVVMPVLREDGGVLPCTVELTPRPGRGGRPVFVVTLRPV